MFLKPLNIKRPYVVTSYFDDRFDVLHHFVRGNLVKFSENIQNWQELRIVLGERKGALDWRFPVRVRSEVWFQPVTGRLSDIYDSPIKLTNPIDLKRKFRQWILANPTAEFSLIERNARAICNMQYAIYLNIYCKYVHIFDKLYA